MPERANNDTFDQNKSDQYILSIRLSTDGFSFFVFNPDNSSFISIVEKNINTEVTYAGNLKQAFREYPFLNWNYKQVFVLQITNRYTLIPLEIFNEEQIEVLYGFNFSSSETETVCHNLLVNNSCAVLFGMDRNVFDFLKDNYPQITFYSQVSVLTEYFSIQSRPVHLKQMFVNLRNNYMDLYCYDRGFTLLVNSYSCSTVTDRSYYILYVWKQLGMDQQNDELYIDNYTTTSSHDELIEMLGKFVRKINVLSGCQYDSPDLDIQMQSFDILSLIEMKGKL